MAARKVIRTLGQIAAIGGAAVLTMFVSVIGLMTAGCSPVWATFLGAALTVAVSVGMLRLTDRL